MSLLSDVRANKAAKVKEVRELLDKAINSNRALTPVEEARLKAGEAELEMFTARIQELEEQQERQACAEKIRNGTASFSVRESEIYRDPIKDPNSPSFFRDMARAKSGDFEAQDRLRRSQQENGVETRALGNTGGAGGSGGELAPPGWLVEQFVQYARPGRVFADLAVHEALPPNISSINIPKLTGGSTTAIQSTQNSALSQTDITTAAVSASICTIGGKEIVSQQLLDQSGVPVDRIVLSDLAADYARQLGSQYISGTGTSGQLRGVLNGAGISTVAYTTATPKFVDGTTSANSFLNRVVSAKVTVNTSRFLPADAIVMHPRRWGWIQEALDGNSRPFITPMDTLSGFNQPGTDGENVAQGAVGTLANLPVYLDPNIPTNLGAGTNQDPVFVCRMADLYLWESPIALETFTQPYADSAGVLFRALAYSAAIPDRYGASVAVINGTGLVAPSL